MRRIESNPNMQKWEGELDRLRLKTYAMPDVAEKMPPDCLGVMSGLFENAYQLSNEVDSAMWSATVLPDVTKHELAIDFATSLTPDTLRDLISDVRPFLIEVTTPQDELYVGRQIEFRIANIAGLGTGRYGEDRLWGWPAQDYDRRESAQEQVGDACLCGCEELYACRRCSGSFQARYHAACPQSSRRGQAATVLNFTFTHFGGAPAR